MNVAKIFGNRASSGPR